MRRKGWFIASLTVCLSLFACGVSRAQQLPCPSMPDDITKVNHDVRSDVQVSVGSLGKLKAGEVGVRTDVVAKNLFEKYPNADRIVVVQMMAATYCSMIRDSKTLKDSEKLSLWSEFSDRVFKFENPNYIPARPPAPKPKGTAPPASKSESAPAQSPQQAEHQSSGSSARQGPPMGSGAAPVTQLDRLVETDRNLTPGDRDRLSNALYEYNEFLEQGRTLGYTLSNEFVKLSQDRQSGALASNVAEHIKSIRAMDAPAWAYYHSFDRIQAKWKYYQEQTAYLFGDNPYNLGPNALINAIEGIANHLTDWSTIPDKSQRPILNIEAAQQNDFEQGLREYFDWITGCQQRLEQIRQSIQPNGVVRPIPSRTPATAPAMFTSN